MSPKLQDALARAYASEKAANKGMAGGYASLGIDTKIPTEELGGTGANSATYLRGDRAWQTPPTGAGNFGQATIPFASWLAEDSVMVTGQNDLLATSKILASVYADSDEIYAQDWRGIIIKDIIAGTGFTIIMKPATGTFKGNVKINWTWS